MTSALTLEDPRYFDRLARAEMSHWWTLGMWRLASLWLDWALRGRRDLWALDVGCGAGMQLARLADRPEIVRVVGIDPSPSALGFAEEGSVARGSALALPFGSDSFDVVTCLDVMQHLPAGGDARAASEIFRVLRPGGVALIRANGRGLWPGVSPDRPPYRLRELVAAVESGGLRVVAASYANCLPSVAAEVLGMLPGVPRKQTRSLGHPAGRGLRLDSPGPIRNRVMGGIAAAEVVVAGRLGIRLPVGHSTMVLATAGPGGSP